MKLILQSLVAFFRFGTITYEVTDITAGHIFEVAYYDSGDRLIGVWFAGQFVPKLPFQGPQNIFFIRERTMTVDRIPARRRRL